jgi:hypothetical protein
MPITTHNIVFEVRAKIKQTSFSIHEAVCLILTLKNINTIDKLNIWCDGTKRHKLYECVKELAQDHYQRIESPKEYIRAEYQRLIQGYKICEGCYKIYHTQKKVFDKFNLKLNLSIKDCLHIIFSHNAINTKEDLDKWCCNKGRHQLYDEVKSMCTNWNKFKDPKARVRYEYQEYLKGFRLYRNISQ